MRKRDRKNNNFVKIIAVLAVFVIIVGVVIKLFFIPSFDFSSDSVKIEAGKTFEAKSYIAKTQNIDIDKIDIKENVDNKKPGEYKVVYSYKNQKKTLTVNVVDTVAPELTPKTDFEIFAGETVTPQMLVDVEDITECKLELNSKGQDLSVIGEYSVTVSATDSGENTSECEVKVTVKDPDTTAPIINGTNNISITLGDKIDLESGVSVKDDFDENPTLTIDDSNLKIDTAGKYSVYYTATDKSGNKSSVKRTITVKNPVDDTSSTSSVTTSSVNTSSASSTTTSENSTVSSANSSSAASSSSQTDSVSSNTSPETSIKLPFDTTGVANQPYLVAVNRAMCTTTVYSKDSNGNYTVPVKAMVCSVGRSGHETPTGRYKTTNRYDWRLMVDGSYGRYAIRINGGIMFHSVCYYTKNESNLEYEEYNKLGNPASLGCIRFCLTDIKWLYDNCPTGFPAVIYDDTSTPGPLGKPSSIKIDVNDVEKRGYDPTDWSANSPWNK